LLLDSTLIYIDQRNFSRNTDANSRYHSIYPLNSSSWNQIYSSISANPTLNFDIIINPDSGPGASAQPNSDYLPAIAKLNTFPNTRLHGYVHTSYTAVPLPEIVANITTYSKWTSTASANVSLSGIFVDEAPSAFTDDDFSYMSSVNAAIHAAGFSDIIFNPGAVADSRYYALADTIVAFENVASAYVDAIPGWIGASFIPQSAFILYGFEGTATDLATTVHKFTAMGLGSLFISTLSEYARVSDLWAGFCADLSAA
jgi:hypothetical protein